MPIGFSDDSEPMWSSICRLVDDQRPDLGHVDLTVADDDDMFHFSNLSTSTRELGVMAYFRAGIQIADCVRQIAAQQFGALTAVSSFCDFASGYGRATRFIAAEIGAERVWAVEVLPTAVEFQRRHLHTHGIQSTTSPDDFVCDERFDMIFVASLFSHLPDRTFGSWLARIWKCVAPGGILALSVHDESLMPADLGAMDASGIHYLRTTEVSALDVDDYGATFVTEDYVARQVAALGDSVGYRRIERGLCFEQDVYVVGDRATLKVEPSEFRRGPTGALDVVEFVDRSTLRIGGWAAEISDSPSPVRVSVHLEQRLLGTVTTSLPRPDVATHLHSDAREHLGSGFDLRVELPARRDLMHQRLLVTARSADGQEFVLHVAPLDALTQTPLGRLGRCEDATAGLMERGARLLRRAGLRGIAGGAARRARAAVRRPARSGQ